MIGSTTRLSDAEEKVHESWLVWSTGVRCSGWRWDGRIWCVVLSCGACTQVCADNGQDVQEQIMVSCGFGGSGLKESV